MRKQLAEKKINKQLSFFCLTSLIMLIALFCTSILKIKAITLEDRIDHFIYQEPKPEKVVYLTFDDGPSKYTADLLNLLEEKEVPAIFFVIGENIELIPNSTELLNDIIDKGHYIGLHSMTHDMDKLYNVADASQNFISEMLELRTKINALTGFESNLCRPPYGGANHFKAGHYEALKEAGLEYVDWNVDSLDWAKSSTDEIFNHVVADFEHAGSPNEVVLLFHEKKLTLEVLPTVIDYFRDLGYEFMPYYEENEFEFLKH